MFETHQKFSGRQHTRWAAFLLTACLCPVVLLLTSPNGAVAVWFTALLTVASLGLAWVNWSKYSHLTVPSLESRRSKAHRSNA